MQYFNNKKDIYKIAKFIFGLIICIMVLPASATMPGKALLSCDSTESQDTVKIDFDQGEFKAGDIVSEINYPNGTIKVFGFNPMFPDVNAAMIFDSGNPTGGDFDLGTPNQFFGGPGMNFEGGSVPSNNVPLNNVLIVSEDLNSDEPDDAVAEEISLIFEFESPVTMISMDLLDLDSGDATLHLFDSLGNEIFTQIIPETGCNGVANIVISVPGVTRMEVALNGSGAIDNIAFLVDQGANNAPVAEDDQYESAKDSVLFVDAPGVLVNDTDIDGDLLTIVNHDTVSTNGGTIALNQDGSFQYTPADGYTGIDSYSYVVSDGVCNDTATVSIVVKDPSNSDPNALDDFYSTDVDSTLIVDTPGVLSNDTDVDGQEVTIISYDSISSEGGSVMLDPDGGFSYTPPSGHEGEDNFTYVITDGVGGTDTAQVIIAVIKSPTDPVANDDVYSTEKNSELQVPAPGVLANDTDPNGDLLTVVNFDSTSALGGSVYVNSDGSLTYAPPQDSVGHDSFTYIIDDGNGNTDTARVFIEVYDVGGDDEGEEENHPPTAEDDNYMTDQDTELLVTDPVEGVLTNDSDPDGDQIAAREVTDAITDQGGTISINSDGTFTYKPGLGFIGTDTYEYVVCDDRDPELCDSALIYIEVKELPVKVFNAFSPNGDGVNDVWIIQGITRFPDNHVQIFNRWGNLVFESTGYDNSAKVWNGESNQGIVFGDQGVPDGAYYYVIELGDGSPTLSGYVVIRR